VNGLSGAGALFLRVLARRLVAGSPIRGFRAGGLQVGVDAGGDLGVPGGYILLFRDVILKVVKGDRGGA